MHWESWTVRSIPAEPEEACTWSVTSRTPGSYAAWDRSSLTVEPAKKPESFPMKANKAPRGCNRVPRIKAVCN